MKCPDCGGFLVDVTFSGIDQSYRCFTCGGVFLHGKTANGLPTEALKNWNEVVVDPELLKMGDNTCPRDSQKLEVFTGESVPEDIVIRRCEQCRWWWFPRDTLFKFKPAQEAKANYLKAWGVVGTIAAIALPVMVMTVVVGGVATRQQITTSADVGIVSFSATYLGNGQEIISFKSPENVEKINYRMLREGKTEWKEAGVKKINNYYQAEIYGLAEGEAYEMMIGGKYYMFYTRL